LQAQNCWISSNLWAMKSVSLILKTLHGLSTRKSTFTLRTLSGKSFKKRKCMSWKWAHTPPKWNKDFQELKPNSECPIHGGHPWSKYLTTQMATALSHEGQMAINHCPMEVKDKADEDILTLAKAISTHCHCHSHISISMQERSTSTENKCIHSMMKMALCWVLCCHFKQVADPITYISSLPFVEAYCKVGSATLHYLQRYHYRC
jgi:hypothetical protein